MKTQAEDKQGTVVKMFRSAIPAFPCLPGCHDCCGPVAASTWEVAQLPVVDPATRSERAARLACAHLGPAGCTVYEDRPLLCRQFGTVAKMACPHGRGPVVMLPDHVEREIQRFYGTEAHHLV